MTLQKIKHNPGLGVFGVFIGSQLGSVRFRVADVLWAPGAWDFNFRTTAKP